MDNILKELIDKNDSINNIRVDIGYKTNYNYSLNINHPINLFNKYEQKIAKFCKKMNTKSYTTYHNDNLTLYIENDINYVYEINISDSYFYNNISLIKYTNTIVDNIIFPNLDKYQNIINHNDNIYKFIIKNINIPIYIHFDRMNQDNTIYFDCELNIQQLSYGFDAIEYLCKQFNS
jgi:hypothetical protein